MKNSGSTASGSTASGSGILAEELRNQTDTDKIIEEINQNELECDPDKHLQNSETKSKEFTVNPARESYYLKAIFMAAVRKGMLRMPPGKTISQYANQFEWAEDPLIRRMGEQPGVLRLIQNKDKFKALFVAAARRGTIRLPHDMTVSQFENLFRWIPKPLNTQMAQQPAVMTPPVETSNGTPNETITSSMSRTPVSPDPWDLEIGPEAPSICNCVVRISKGTEFLSINKVDRYVVPYNLGLIPRTLGPDKEEGIDTLVIMQEPVAHRWSVRAKVIGYMPIYDPIRLFNEDKIIAVCADDPEYQDCNDIKDLPPHRFAELCCYVEDYKKNENPNAVYDFLPATKAREAIQHSMDLFAKKQEKKFQKQAKKFRC